MKFNLLFKSARSATFELENQDIYYAEHPFSVLVDGKEIYKDIRENVFSIYNLSPNSDVRVKVIYQDKVTEEVIHTEKELLTINVRECGAKGDGIHIDTNFIQAAINACPPNGRVLIPAGNYFIRPLWLKSNMTLELDANANLLADTDRNNFPYLPGEIELTDRSDKKIMGTWEGDPYNMYVGIINCYGVENVNIIGTGVINGNAEKSDWWPLQKKITVAAGPRLVFIKDSKNITLQGITCKNSPAWTVHPYFSENINVLNIKIINPKQSVNTDGCNPEVCNNVKIIGVFFSVGDDCVAVKSGKMYVGMKFKQAANNTTIRNCLMQDGHGGVVLGSEMSGGVKNLTVERCIFQNTDRGLRIKTRRGRGKYAVIDNVKFENILMHNVLSPFVMNMFYYCDPDGKTEYVYSKEKLPVDDRTPYLGKFHFKNISVDDAHYCAGYFYGLPEQRIKEVILENVSFTYAKNAGKGKPALMSYADDCHKVGLYFNNVENVVLDNVKIDGQIGEKIIAINVDKVKK